MKTLIVVALAFLSSSTYGQEYPFVHDFVKGSIILKDSSTKTGQIKWFPDPTEKLKFRESENADTKKYSPEDLIGFSVDTLKFVSIFNFPVYAENYALLGKTRKVKHAFAQLVDSGSYNIYLVLVSGYNAIASGIQTYPNFLFEKRVGDSTQYAAYPYGTRMKEKRYEQAKEDLYLFFKDYPDIIEKIRSFNQRDDFFDIIHLMEKLN